MPDNYYKGNGRLVGLGLPGKEAKEERKGTSSGHAYLRRYESLVVKCELEEDLADSSHCKLICYVHTRRTALVVSVSFAGKTDY